MRGDHRTAITVAALLALSVAVAVAFAAEGTGGAEPPPVVNPAAPLATPEVTILNKHEVEGVLGREVRSAADENMGRIVDVLVDRTGQVRAAVVVLGALGKLEPLPE